MLIIKTLGKFEVLLDGVSLLENTDPKRGLLLVYLLEQGKPQSRVELARLLWPGNDDTTAMGNLRSMVLRMRREGLEPYLEVERSTLAVNQHANIHYDVAQLRTLTAQGDQTAFADLQAAADLYGGDFLPIAEIDHYPQLEEWAAVLRRAVETKATLTLKQLIQKALEDNCADHVTEHAYRLATLLPFSDEAQLLYMQVLRANNQIAEAIHHFRQYKHQLQEEMGITEMDPALESFVSDLMSPRRAIGLAPQPVPAQPKVSTPVKRTQDNSPLPSLPYLTKQIIGRVTETQLLNRQLDMQMRLISIVGMGGSGKTFFIRSQFPSLLQRFQSGLHFVDLNLAAKKGDSVEESLLQAIAHILALPKQTGASLQQQVLTTLQKGHQCLILDNFETHLAAVPVVNTLLQNAPRLTVIVTSRVRLSVRNEQVIAIGGISVGSSDQANSESEAVRLFSEQVQRDHPNFQLDESNHALILSICQRMGGHPLIIEQAAQQVSFYGLQAVATAILDDDLSMLHSAFEDSANAHYDIHAILGEAWMQLAEETQGLLRASVIFAGDWHYDDMQAIWSTRRSTYTALLNASLLSVGEPGWFSLHPLMRYYIVNQLEPLPTWDELVRRHTAYFLRQLHLGEQLLEPSEVGKGEIFARLHKQQQDIFAAWRSAVQTRAWDLLNQAIVSLGHYVVKAQVHQEGIKLMQLLLDQLPAPVLMTSSQRRMAGQAAFFVNILSTQDTANSFAKERNAETISWLEQVGTPHESAIVHGYVERAHLIPAQIPPARPSHTAQTNQLVYA